MSTLNPAQLEVERRGLLSCGFHCVLQMPTGSGKTWLAERAIDEVLARGGRAVYVTPLRAQADELLQRWRSRFGDYPVGAYAGPLVVERAEVPYRRARVLIMTPERLDACTRWWRSHWDWMPEVELVVVDEFHLLADASRGPRLEGTLGRLRRLNPLARILALSATLGNREELAEWLEGVEFVSEWRPIPLSWKTVRYRRAVDKAEVTREVVQECVLEGGRSLVFVQSRRRAEYVAAHLSAAGLRATHHHAGLPSAARRQVEKAFRDGEIDVLVATATLEMGVNLPVRQVVLYDLQVFDGIDYRPLPIWSAWQRGGRAGRPGQDDRGEVVLLAPAWSRDANRYLRPDFECIRSGLSDPAALSEQILTEVATGLCRSLPQLERAIGATLGSYQRRLPPLGQVVGTMIDARMLAVQPEVEDRPSRLVATRLGRIAVRQMLAPQTVLVLARALAGEDIANWSFLDLLMLACSTPDAEPRLAVDFEELEDLAECLSSERSWLLRDVERVQAALGASGRQLLSVIKMAACLRAWTRAGDMDAVAEATSTYPFEVARLRESLARILAAGEAALVPDDAEPSPARTDEPNVRERLAALAVMVNAGLDEEAVTLTLLRGIGPTLARRLSAAGISDIEDLAGADPAEVAKLRGISLERAAALVEQAADIVPQRSAWCFREAGPTLTLETASWPPEVDPYRLGRALDLVVRARDGLWLVTGGADPHRVVRRGGALHCDCPDYLRGGACKHVLAVRLACGDDELRMLAGQLRNAQRPTRLDLHALWFDPARRATA